MTDIAKDGSGEQKASQKASPSQPKDPDNLSELDKLIQDLGDLCHEHYLGCSQNKEAPDGYEYAYDTEVIWILDTPKAKALLSQQVIEAEEKMGEAIIERMRQSNHQWEKVESLIQCYQIQKVENVHNLKALKLERDKK